MQDEMYFVNREEAGKRLAAELLKYKDEDVLIFALPRGGVEVAYEVAQILHKPMYVFVARKIGAPGNPEFGIGAIAEGDVLILNTEILEQYNISQEDVDEIAGRELDEMARRISIYRHGEPLPSVIGKTVIMVDDGLATGVTAHAAITSLQNMQPERLVFAAPVCAYYSAEALSEFVDDMVCVIRPFDMATIGNYYKYFEPVTDERVNELITEANKWYK